VTARPVAPVIPSASPGRQPGKPGAGHPMPLASPPGRPDAVYGFGRIDASGRVADRVTIAALGWRGGDRLTVTADAAVMIARRDPGGLVTVPARPYVVIPAALRRRCGLRAGDHVLPAASPGQDTLTAHSFAVVDQALKAHADQTSGNARQAVRLLTQAAASHAHRIHTASQPQDPAALTTISAADIPEHLYPHDQDADDQWPGQYL
jgi:AAA lid domain-containing protein